MIIKNNNFSVNQIAYSGQCFRWKQVTENSFIVPAMNKILFLAQHDDEIFLSCDENEFNSIWKDYFDLSRDYSDIGNRILSSTDSHLIDSYKLGSGIRILKQDLWEMIFSFMISQNNNIKRISKSIELICERVGLQSDNYFEIVNLLDKCEFNESKLNISKLDNCNFFNEIFSDLKKYDDFDSIILELKKVFQTYKGFKFPTANEIPLEIFDDTSLGLGYRAPYLRGICEFVNENPIWISNLKNMNFDDAFKTLISIKGIGNKVANCVCLFGLNFTDSFPIDTHIKQLLEKYYPDGIDLTNFPDEAGILQQYLFNYELVMN